MSGTQKIELSTERPDAEAGKLSFPGGGEYEVAITERWDYRNKEGDIFGRSGNPITKKEVYDNDGNKLNLHVMEVPVKRIVVGEDGEKKEVTETEEHIAPPERLVLLTKLKPGKAQVAVKAYRVVASASGSYDDNEGEREILFRCYPDSRGLVTETKSAVEFEYKGFMYHGLVHPRFQAIPLSRVVLYISHWKKQGILTASEACAMVLDLYRAVLDTYKKLHYKRMGGEHHVRPFDLSSGNILVETSDAGVPSLAALKAGEVKLQPIDFYDRKEDGRSYGERRRRTLADKAEEAMFGDLSEPGWAMATQIFFHAFHEMLRGDLVKVDCSADVLSMLGEHFKPDAVVDTSKGRRASDGMFGFYDALLAEMQVENQGQAAAVVVPAVQENPVVVRLAKNLSDLYGCVQYILEVVDPDGKDPDYAALRDYRNENGVQDSDTKKWKAKPPETASAALRSIHFANAVVAQAKSLAGAGKFKHRVHARYRKGGDLALSNNKGAIAGIVLAIFLGGIIPGLIAWIVMSKLEAQQTKREKQVERMRATWKKPPTLGGQFQPPSIFSQFDLGDLDSHEPLASRSSFGGDFDSSF